MSRSTVTPAEALQRLLDATKLIDFADCKDERVWQALGAAQGTAEGVLRDGLEAEPVAYLRFRAAQSWGGSGNHDIEHNEWLETCHAHEIGDDKLPAFPVYAAPVAAQPAIVAASGITYEADDGTISAHQDGEMLWHAHVYANMEEVDMSEAAKQAVAKLNAAPAIAAPVKMTSRRNELDERKTGPLWDAVQRACGELPKDCEIRLYMERGSGIVVWSDSDGSDHLIEGEGFVSDDINEAIDAAIATGEKP